MKNLRHSSEQHIIKPEDQAKYPVLADDFALLEEYLMPEFRLLVNRALYYQNQFYRYQGIFIVGIPVIVILETLKFSSLTLFHNSLLLELLEIVLAIGLVLTALAARKSKALRCW